MKNVYVSAGTGENPWLAQAAVSCTNEGYQIEVLQETSEKLDSEEKNFREVLDEIPS